MRLLILTILTFSFSETFSQQSLDNLKTLTTYYWEIVGPDSTLNGLPIKEMSFHSGFTKLDSGDFKGWYYGEEGVMMHKIEKNIRTSYSIFDYLIKGDSLHLEVTLRTNDLHEQPLVYKAKYTIDNKTKTMILLTESKKLTFEGTIPDK